MNLVEVLSEQAAIRPKQLAIIEAQRSISFSDLYRQVHDGARYLRGLGLQAGDPVVILLPMSIDLYIVLLSAIQAGLIAVFFDPGAGKKHIAACCQMVPPKAFIGTLKAHVLGFWDPSLRRIPQKIRLHGWCPGTQQWGRGVGSEIERIVSGEAPALITFTSGSTGEPKAAVRSHAFLLAQHRILAKTLGHCPGSVELSTLPIFALSALASGQTMLIPAMDLRHLGAFDPQPILRQIEQYRPISAIASPAFFEGLIPASQSGEMHSFERLFTGGAPVFPGFLRRLQECAPQAKVMAVYGSTEAEPIAEIAWNAMSDADLLAMQGGAGLLTGLPVKDIACRVITNRWGQVLGPWSSAELSQVTCQTGEVGEIVVSGDHVLPGYLHGRGDEQNKFRVDGIVWHRTGDLGRFDAQGRLWLLGRCSAQVQDRHGTLYPFAVECAAMQVVGVRRAALVPHPDKRILFFTGDAEPQTVQRQLAWAHLDTSLRVTALPMDRRHHAKIDYPALQQLAKRHLSRL